MYFLLNYLALTIPGTDGNPAKVEVPADIPSGGLEEGQDGAVAIQNSITIFLITITVLSLIFLIFGGVKWIMSQGDKAKLDSARKTIIYALIGLGLSFLSFVIVTTVGNVMGVTLL